MKVVVTGAAGLVGRHLVAAFAARHDQVTALGHAALDVTDADAVRRRLDAERPALVLNCAVLDVDVCEREPARAEAVNVAGPRALATVAAEHGAGIVHFSSNYVFDGEPWGRAPYTIDDPPVPLNVYGHTKLAGERAVAAACPRSWIVRTSWVYGPGKANFLAGAPGRLRAGETVRAATDLAASTTHVDDLVARTLELVDRCPAGTYHVVNAGSPTQLDFALEAARLVDAPATLVEAGTEAALGRPARRPRWTPMRCLASERQGLPPLRDWRTALADYVRHQAAIR